MSVTGVFLTILTSGLPLTVSRHSATSFKKKSFKKTHQVVSSGVLLSILMSIFVVLIIVIGKPIFQLIFTDNSSYLVVLTLIPMLIASAIYSPVKGFLWGLEDFFAVNIVEIFEQIVRFIICVILFALIPNNIIPAGLSLSIACIFSTTLGFVFYFKKGGKLFSPQKQLNNVFKTSLPIMSIRVAGSILPPLISIILPFLLVKAGYSNSQALSDIGILMGMTFPILTIPSTVVGSLSMALVPKLTILNQEKNNNILSSQISNSIKFTLFCCFLCVPILTSLGVPICEFLFKNTNAGVYLKNFAWVVVPMGLSQISTSILNSLNKEKFVFYSYFISSVVMMIAILILPQFVGASALLIGLALQGAFVSILNIGKIKKIAYGNTSTINLLIKFSIISLMIVLFINWITPLIWLIFPTIIMIAVLCIISMILFVILSYAFNVIDLGIITNIKRNRLSKKV